MNLAEKLVTLRKQKGLTQEELAEKLNLSRQAISRWEMGGSVPGTDSLKVLSEVYGVSVDYLLNDAADDFVKDDRNQKPVHAEQTENAKPPKRLIAFALAVIIGLTITIGIGVALVCSQSQKYSVPMDEMSTMVEDEYTAGYFSIK